jgi:GSCFA family protein
MSHPYSDMPSYRRWRSGVAGQAGKAIDPVVDFPFSIAPGERIAAAGSCFAQHVARHLRNQGFGFMDTEPAHPMLSDDIARSFGYGIYSARYGNIYTSRQLLQLLQRAYGTFVPVDDMWESSGRYYDPFRPAIQPGGFATRQEFLADRAQHLAAVRRMLEQADTFIFTLGLTECWVAREDGAAYPMCPGTVAGEFDPARHALVNLEVEDVHADLLAFLRALRAVNPGVKVILTVSPVALAATANDKHVLLANTLSKATLRIAAERLSREQGVAYFPAYEIITCPSIGGSYLLEDLRSISEAGVENVMDVFFRRVATSTHGTIVEERASNDTFIPRMKQLVDAVCEEDRLDMMPSNDSGD